LEEVLDPGNGGIDPIIVAAIVGGVALVIVVAAVFIKKQ
jgi:hypothetical protein